MRPTDKVLIPNTGSVCDMIAAGKHPVFGDVTPDEYTAYVTLHFSKTFPLIAGPESSTGAIFGIHPAVVARSFPSIVNKQMNMGHTLVALGSKEDRICGCVLGASFPEEPADGWVIPETVEEAPDITAFAALFKQARGVDKMVGQHLTGKVKMAVSMEFTYYRDEVGIYDPTDRVVYDRKEIPKSLWMYLAEDEKGRLIIRKNTRSKPLSLALGGLSGMIWYSGVGYTDRPAESTAGIDSIAAGMMHREQGMMVCEVAELPAWSPGMSAKWPGGQWGRGTVKAVYLEGTHSRHGKRLTASCSNPVLELLLPDGVRIHRRASSVKKI